MLLDTDILIDVQRHHRPAVEWFTGLSDVPTVPGFVVMELIQSARNSAEVRRAVKLVSPFEIAWPSVDDCEHALGLFTKFHLSHGLGLIDSLIAATAVGRSTPLCTFNVKHYRAVPGLVLAQPYTR